MKVILLERVPKLGQMGDVVDVAPGYARNYLIPQGKALRATEETLKEFEKRRRELEARNLEARREAEEVARRIEGTQVTILRPAGEAGQLYGSVSAREIVEALREVGITVDRRQVRLERTIKTLGVHTVVVALHPEVEVPITVNVARSEEEAAIQLEAAGLLERPEEMVQAEAGEAGAQPGASAAEPPPGGA